NRPTSTPRRPRPADPGRRRQQGRPRPQVQEQKQTNHPLKENSMARIEVRSEVTGKVWKIEVPVGSKAEADQPVMIVESMKMEIPVSSEEGGTVAEILVAEGDAVEDGQVVA